MIIRIKRKRFKFLFTTFNSPRALFKGPLGTLNFPLNAYVKFNKQLFGSPKNIMSLARHLNTFRCLVYGVFAEIVPEGVGFRFCRYPGAPSLLGLSLGYSHLLFWNLPSQCFFRCEKYRLLLFGSNPSLIRIISLHIRDLRFPDAYKAKGLKFARDEIRLKPGKIRQR